MKKFLKNNKGASLILVIGCVALLSVIGSMLLLVTANNREMKALEKKIQDTFYQAESGSDELLVALEVEAEKALSNAFSDMMVYFSALSEEERETRIADYFEEALKAALTKADAAESLMGVAFSDGASAVVDVEIPSDGVVTEAADPTKKQTNLIRMTGVTIKYTDGDGNASTITTDITVQSGIPDIQAGLVAAGATADYTDFALISNGNVNMHKSAGSIVSAKVNGNLYTAGDIDVNVEANLELSNAEKVLVKKDIKVAEGKVTIDNSGKISSGQGVWANGLTVLKEGVLEGISNFYIADDLTVEESSGKVTLGGTGTEYIGFSGNTVTDETKVFDGNSAITINDAKDITIDLSGLTNLVLDGMSYIYDKKWAGSSGSPIMQGESLAYKDMQVMYLAPAQIIGTSNPVLTSQFTGMPVLSMAEGSRDFEYHYDSNDSSKVLDLKPYLNETNPFIRRDVILDGGATSFTYLYLNFKGKTEARNYINAYLSTELGDDIKSRISSIGTSEIKLAQNNYSSGVLMEYSGGTLTFENMTGDINGFQTQSAFTANNRQEALFTSFRFNSSTVYPDWTAVDVLASAVLSENAVTEIQNATSSLSGDDYSAYGGDKTLSGGVYNGFVVVNGDLVLDGVEITGIVLVNGDVTFRGATGSVEGLVIATGQVNLDGVTSLTANKAKVEELLEDANIAKFFRTTSSGSGAEAFLSTEAVDVKFDNWQRN